MTRRRSINRLDSQYNIAFKILDAMIASGHGSRDEARIWMTPARYHVCAVKVMMIPRSIMSIVNDQKMYMTKQFQHVIYSIFVRYFCWITQNDNANCVYLYLFELIGWFTCRDCTKYAPSLLDIPNEYRCCFTSLRRTTLHVLK